VLFPTVLGMAVDAIKNGTTRRHILYFALLLVAINLVKGVFMYAQRWILIGISREIEFDLRNDLFKSWKRRTRASISAIAPATSWRA